MVAVVVVVRSEPNLTPEETAGTTNLFLLFFFVYLFLFMFFLIKRLQYRWRSSTTYYHVVARAAWWPGQHGGQGNIVARAAFLTRLLWAVCIYIYIYNIYVYKTQRQLPQPQQYIINIYN